MDRWRGRKIQSAMRVKSPHAIVISRAPGNPRQGRVALAHGVVRAALGRGGVAALKREGDGATPLGRFPVRAVLYRADRVTRPRTLFPLRAIRGDDAWSEDPADRGYNRLVKASSRPGIDRLRRDDRLYDVILVLGFNDRPRVRGRGSAIFVHLARRGYAPTAGCIGLAPRDLRALLRELRPGAEIVVT
jgi:L,D-peptidoglycan transpeptidase YkuD (ErfK/YbiS/YcfS/YnhG family)